MSHIGRGERNHAIGKKKEEKKGEKRKQAIQAQEALSEL